MIKVTATLQGKVGRIGCQMPARSSARAIVSGEDLGESIDQTPALLTSSATLFESKEV